MNSNKTEWTPQLRFPEFREAPGWRTVSLAEVSVPVTERVGTKKLTPVSISAGVGFVPQSEKFGRDISGDQYQLYTRVKDGDFVYNKGNSLKFPQGCIYLLQGWGEVAAPNVFICFRLKDGYSNGFFQNCFEKNIHGEQLKKHITSGARSNGLLNIGSSDFFGVEIPTPSSAEQQKIAECLASLDELIAAQVKQLDALKRYKKGLMQRMFPREGETKPRLRFAEFEADGDWEAQKFGEAATFYNGRAYQQDELLERGKYKVLRVGNFFTSKSWYYSDLELDDTKYCVEGDLLYAWSASFGPRIWNGEKTIYHYHIWKVEEKNGIDKGFLFICLENETEKMKAKSANGLGLLHITKGTIEDWLAYFPSQKEQQKIAAILSSLDERIAAQIQQLAAPKKHKIGLMQGLFPAPQEVEA